MHPKYIHVISLPLTVLTTFVFANNSAVAPHIVRLILFYSFFTIFAAFYYLYARHNHIVSRAPTLFIYILTVTLLLIIGVTGWVVSPFFYFIYLLTIFYIQVFAFRVVLAFIVTLFGLLIGYFNIPLASIFDKIVIILLIIPISRMMQSMYLNRSQYDKKILILEDKDKSYSDTAEEYMGNKVTKLGFDMRQMLSDIAQIARFNEEKGKPSKQEVALEHIEEIAQKAMGTIDEFEEKSTGRKILHGSTAKKAAKKG